MCFPLVYPWFSLICFLNESELHFGQTWDTTQQDSFMMKENTNIHQYLLNACSNNVNTLNNNTEIHLSLDYQQDNLCIFSSDVLWPSCHSDYSNHIFVISMCLVKSYFTIYTTLSCFSRPFLKDNIHTTFPPSPCRTNNHPLLSPNKNSNSPKIVCEWWNVLSIKIEPKSELSILISTWKQITLLFITPENNKHIKL